MTKFINKLENLTEKLRSCNLNNKEEVAEIIANTELDQKTISNNCTWTDHKYSRNLVYRDNNFELLILCWKKEHSSSIHNHDQKSCWVKILEGNATEELYSYKLKDNKVSNLHLINERKANEGEHLYVDGSLEIMHRIVNTGDEDLMTLHLYATPIKKVLKFSPSDQATSESNFDTEFTYPKRNES